MQQSERKVQGTSFSDAPLLNEFPFFFDGFAAWVCRHCQHIPPYYRGGNYVWQASAPPPNQFVDMHLRFCPGLNPRNMPKAASPHMQQQAQQHMQQQAQLRSQQQGTYPGMQDAGMSQEGGFPYPMQQQQQGQNPIMMQQQQMQQQHMQQQQMQEQDETQRDQGAPDPPGVSSPQSGRLSAKKQQGEASSQSQGEIVPASGALSLEAQSQGAQWQFPVTGRYPNQPQQQFHYPYPGQMMSQPLGAGALAQYPHQMPPQAAHGAMALPPSTTPASGKPKRKSSASKISPKGRPTDDATYKAAMDFLTKKTVEMARPAADPPGSDVGQSLIDRSDTDLLTDYFFHMMQQLVVCRFSEKDRKTRGGKRENINIGYGGLQCIHCIEAPSARKFFWSTVDRLANSFAEIPSHVLKCKHCPENVKDALLALKGRHPDQMQMLPRGSQKVFFRRMWRRLHDGDSAAGEAAAAAATPLLRRTSSVSEGGKGRDPPLSEPRRASLSSAAAAEVLKTPGVAAPAAAEALAKSLEPAGSGNVLEGHALKKRRVLLAIPEDKDWLSDTDCFVRSNIEVFSATQQDVEHATADRKYPIKLGQVGIRCLHCAMAQGGARGAAVSYPYSISGIYESVREFQRLHLDTCENVPQDLKDASDKLGSGAASLSSVLRRYFVQAARALGLHDTEDGGIRAGGEIVPVSTAAFQTPGAAGSDRGAVASASAFPSSTLMTTDTARSKEPPGSDAGTVAAETGRKRKAAGGNCAEEGKATEVNPSLPTSSVARASEGEPLEESEAKRATPDAPGKESESPKEKDAPGKWDVPGKEDAPGERATTGAEDAPEESPPTESVAV